ncbi:hypothetical protein J4H86_01705 [Spiractinospora alimapuensis]|uniref:hypothetical protein n=1 Tax=Spiractinospora alimapuensis TaxID=2820884 RepID=UPI001F23BA59|nr:hypothetical protein [Spiractinospora alimapuensis]QVQ52581.1 hypothetical protein J4H86_01705 [Spiractinospora alimapuensis]
MTGPTFSDQRTCFQEARQKAFEEGFEQGRQEMAAESVLVVLCSRGVAVSAAQEERIWSCHDLDVLRGWLLRAATADSAAALFVDSPGPVVGSGGA